MKRLAPLSATMIVMVSVAQAADVVTQKSTKATVVGSVTSVTRTGVTVKSKLNQPTTVPANDIAQIKWDDEPPQLTLVRSHEASGLLQKALDGYLAARKANKSSNANLAADIEYFIARTTARMALTDTSKLDEAIKQLEAFATGRSDSYHHFETQLFLGQLYAAKRDSAKAKIALDAVGKASWADYRMAARTTWARVMLAEGKVDEALAEFEAVIAAKAGGPAEKLQHHTATLGKASCLVRKKDYDTAVKTLDSLINDLPAGEPRLHAEAYLRQGDCLQAQGKPMEAVLAYLHVDVLFAQEQTLHAESLFHLARLWVEVGHPERAATDGSKLQELYPQSEWAKRVSAPAGK